MRIATLLALFAGTLVIAPSASAQQAGPEQTFRELLDALAERRWLDAADRIDLAEFGEQLRQIIQATRQMPASRAITPEQLMRIDSLKPRAVAEYEARRMNETMRELHERPPLLRDYPGVPTLDSLDRLDARHAAALWIRARDPRRSSPDYLESLRRDGCVIDSATVAAVEAAALPDTHVVVGTIVRDTIAFVVTQQVLRRPGEYGRDQGDDVLGPRVVRMRRARTGWLLHDWREWFDPSGVQEAFIYDCERPPSPRPPG